MHLLPTGPEMTAIISGPQWSVDPTFKELKWPRRVLSPCSFHSALLNAPREAAAVLSAMM